MDAELTARWIRLVAERVADRREWLTELDSAIGDGDHGINLDRGLTIVVTRLDQGVLPRASDGDLLAAIGRTISGTVGGASGALYGRGLTRAAERLSGSQGRADGTDRLADALEAAIDAIVGLGHATTGEKTMLDALVPASTALRDAAGAGLSMSMAMALAAEAAERGSDTTIPMLATKGRASYLGDRSIGHRDPGSASSALLLRALADAVATSR
jgi:dihydroxyacetone kinase-like protein